ncbi:CocE/NonD family hydrolase [Streptacidiphilus neutrinimicus]|uniref:CocE/NonD family hydrolase n=1 Tax=Streptacidiphilus neutrinimicus TaxID=105420 RepID=UPI0005A5E5F7|nr:CocE/NonD family hydrolase [Streptacidiphilus neutrinimicus]
MRTLKDEWITASDGVRICADVYLPDGDGPFPALYAVAPYPKDLQRLPALPAFRFIETGPLDYWTGHGYAVVVGDQRGTGRSAGRFELFGPAEQRDLYDTIEWIAARPWSTGKVSMIGESAYSVNQWLAAAQRPPHLTCALVYNGFTNLYHDAVYHGGVYSMGFLNFWSTDHIRASATIGGGIPPRPGGVTTDIIGMSLDRPVYDDWWDQRAAKVEDIDIPVLNIAWWHNIGVHLRGQLDGYQRLQGTDKRLVVLAGSDIQERHFLDSQELYYQPEFLDAYIRPWYDHWLKGVDNGVMDSPPVRLQVANSGGRLREESEWPPRRATATAFYLNPEPAGAVDSLNDGSLTTTTPSAGQPTVYDYPNPEWTVGTTVITDGIPQPTRGILTFTTPPLDRDTEVTGKITLVLYAESDQTDTDFHVKISEQKAVPRLTQALMHRVAKNVPPPSAMVTRGWLKASHRTHPPQPIEPGSIVRYEIEVWPTSYLFRKGSRIRLEIANGDSAVADGLIHHYYGHQAGRNLIHHDADHPSHLILPVIH